MKTIETKRVVTMFSGESIIMIDRKQVNEQGEVGSIESMMESGTPLKQSADDKWKAKRVTEK